MPHKPKDGAPKVDLNSWKEANLGIYERLDHISAEVSAIACRLNSLERYVADIKPISQPPGLETSVSCDNLLERVSQLEKIFIFIDIDSLDRRLSASVEDHTHLRSVQPEQELSPIIDRGMSVLSQDSSLEGPPTVDEGAVKNLTEEMRNANQNEKHDKPMGLGPFAHLCGTWVCDAGEYIIKHWFQKRDGVHMYNVAFSVRGVIKFDGDLTSDQHDLTIKVSKHIPHGRGFCMEELGQLRILPEEPHLRFALEAETFADHLTVKS